MPSNDHSPVTRCRGFAIYAGIVLEDHADNWLDEFENAGRAIIWAKSEGHVTHRARVRRLNDKVRDQHPRSIPEMVF